MDKVLLRPEEVAQSLGLSRTKVYELMRTGELHSVRIGVSRRVLPEAVHEFVAALAADSAA